MHILLHNLETAVGTGLKVQDAVSKPFIHELSQLVELSLFAVSAVDADDKEFLELCDAALCMYTEFSHLANRFSFSRDYFKRASSALMLLSHLVDSWSSDQIIGCLEMIFFVHMPAEQKGARAAQIVSWSQAFLLKKPKSSKEILRLFLKKASKEKDPLLKSSLEKMQKFLRS